ncbi:MAG: hypothetical protein K2H82_07090 [Oscillospiraceae bacterium]|nr:hypothetical protein [Oscillospiraceae bacterium]
METYQEFLNRIQAFELPLLSLRDGDFIANASVAEKVNENHAFHPFYGDTVVFDLSEQEKSQLNHMIEQLYQEAPDCFSERLINSTMHMTLHDLSNFPVLAEVFDKMQENEIQLRQLLSDMPIPEQSIQMKSQAVFNMVNTSLVLGLYPADAQEYKKLMYLYSLIDRIMKLPYPMTPHITLAYYRRKGFSQENKRKLEHVVNTLNQSSHTFHLTTKRLYYQHFESMNAYNNILKLMDMTINQGEKYYDL